VRDPSFSVTREPQHGEKHWCQTIQKTLFSIYSLRLLILVAPENELNFSESSDLQTTEESTTKI